MNDYTIHHGDCLDWLPLIPDDSVDLVVMDPPYDIKNTKAGGNSPFAKSIQKMNDELAEGNLSKGFNPAVLPELVRVCKGINLYAFCNKAQLPLYFDFFVNRLGCNFDLIKWVKTNASPTWHNKYLSDTEYCFYARKRGYCQPENYEDASTLYHAPMNTKDKRLYDHATIKPLPLIKKLIRNSSKPGAVVLDPYMGSGTTGEAAIRLERGFIGIELLRKHYDTADARCAWAMWQRVEEMSATPESAE